EAATAILTADVKKLSAVKGLGKKTAEKIVLELHGKISAAEVMSASGDFSGDFSLPAAEDGLSAADEDAVSALQNLGFTRSESVRAVERAKKSGARGLEEIIRRALQG
ncbi:MAG: helix-hairpin-helix domain-containing protein, partial [Candidatus Scatosoma sp.]